jgi:hypothetical protein
MLSLLCSAGVASPVGVRQQNGAMTISAAPPMQQRLASMAAAIHQLIPAAEVRLFGSRAQGTARPDSDVDLLITAPDAWLAQHDRFALLGELWGPWPNPISRSIWCFTPAAKWHDVPWSRDRWCMRLCATACCSMASPEAARLLRIARRDQVPARTPFIHTVRDRGRAGRPLTSRPARWGAAWAAPPARDRGPPAPTATAPR